MNLRCLFGHKGTWSLLHKRTFAIGQLVAGDTIVEELLHPRYISGKCTETFQYRYCKVCGKYKEKILFSTFKEDE